MKTPDEMRLTWCPWARAVSFADNVQLAIPACNRVARNENGEPGISWDLPAFKCIADDCSQWVWVDETTGDKRRFKQEKGFCGLNHGMALKVFGR